MSEKSQLKLVVAVVFFVLLALLVLATETGINGTENRTINTTINDSVAENVVLEQANLTPMTETNLIISTDESKLVNLEDNISIEELDSFIKVVNDNGFKFNDETKKFFESSPNKSDEKSFIIKYKSSFDKAKLDSLSAMKSFGDFRVSSFKAKVADIESFILDDSVESIELDQNLNLLSENVPFNVQQVGADSVWNMSRGTGVKVAVLDTGIAEHDDLIISGGWNVIDDSSDYSDANGHGTMVSGVLAALLNDEGLVGVSPNVSLYSVKVMNGGTGSLSDAIAGVEWAVDNNMSIVSMSFGFDGYSEIFKEVLHEAYDYGILLIGASGNDGTNGVLYPAAYTDVIAVGAVDESNNRANFSNYGFELELVAPGVGINSTSLDDGYIVASGTSLAVPHVAGVAALIWSYNQSLSNQEVRAKLRNDALDLGDVGKDDYYGYGLVRVNLSSENYNYTPLNYYYEIYNISDYSLENESYLFWLSGNGTIDDVNFSEGYYLVNKTINDSIISQKIFVNENGRIIILWIPSNTWDDSFSFDGTTGDGFLWTSDSLDFKYSDSGGGSNADVVCYDDDYIPSTFNFWKCWSASSIALYNCRGVTELDNFCSANPSDCSSTGLTSWHSIPSGNLNTKTGKVLRIQAYYDCEYDPVDVQTSSFYYYVVDRKKTECASSSMYRIKGRYSSLDWVSLATLSCASGKSCDSAIAGSYEATSSSYDFRIGSYHPCKTSDGYSCTQDSDCLTNHSCIGSICGGNETTTDLAIVSIIPIQVIPDVDMVKDKSGYVRVVVYNNGSASVTAAKVIMDISGISVTMLNTELIKSIDAYQNQTFDFGFVPNSVGNALIKVNVTLVS